MIIRTLDIVGNMKQGYLSYMRVGSDKVGLLSIWNRANYEKKTELKRWKKYHGQTDPVVTQKFDFAEVYNGYKIKTHYVISF